MKKRSRRGVVVGLVAGVLAAGTKPADASEELGWFAGNSGGMERGVQLFDRSYGQVWFTVTGPSGLYRSKAVPAGEYLAACLGNIAPIRVEPGRLAWIDWAGQPGYDVGADTWSPARRKFGQTFVAFGPWVRQVSFWLPSGPIALRLALREDGPNGRLVGEPVVQERANWVSSFCFQPGQWPMQVGRRYYLSIESVNGEPFAIGMPGLGEVYPDGQAYYDDEPQLDSDLALGITADNDGLSTTVDVAYSQGLGFIKEGPGSGMCTWAGQTFVATTRNVIAAYANAGWGYQPSRILEFVYSIHEDGPDGRQVGPERRVEMICDWGATALWFPDQVRLVPGKRYMLKYRRADGGRFYAYLARDIYKGGCAVRDGEPMGRFDLTCTIRGQRQPGYPSWPYNVMVAELTPRRATIAWATLVPSTSQVEYGLLLDQRGRTVAGTAMRRTKLDERLVREHRVTLTGLLPGKAYAYAVWSRPGKPDTKPLRSKVLTFRTLEDPTQPETPPLVSPPARAAAVVPLKNPGFENGLEGWSQLGGRAGVLTDLKRYRPHGGKAVCGWRHIHEAKTEQAVPRKLEPPVRDMVYQTVAVQPGKTYLLSAWILTDEREGGWERNDRIRLVADPTGAAEPTTREWQDAPFVTQWYTTGGLWVRRRLRFVPDRDTVRIGVEFYQWWALRENHLYVDDVQLIELER